METKESFLKKCSSENRIVGSHIYDPALLQKAIHLVRNPVDNAVSNFHLAAARQGFKEYENNMKGFRKWCAHRTRIILHTLGKCIIHMLLRW